MSKFQTYHGIALAANSWIQNLVIEPVTVDPTPVGPARAWYNSTEKALKFSSLDAGGAVIVETVATGAEVQAVVDALTALGARVSGIEGNYVKKDGSVAFTGDIDAGGNKLTNVAAGTAATDGVNYGQLQAAIGSLANAFKYIGTVSGGQDAGTAFDLTNVSDQTVGAYYKVAAAGYFKVGTEGSAFYANLNDGLVFNVSSGVDIVDNTNSTVAGTAGFIAVTGSADTGFTVDIDNTFKVRVTTLESGLAAEIARAQAAEGDLSTLTTANKTSLVAAINSEVSRATSAETTLQGNIDAEATARDAADTALGNKIGTLANLTTSVKTDIVSALNSEVSRATAAEGANASAISAEVTRATGVEAGLRTDLDAEVARAEAAESALSSDIGDLSTLTTTAKGSVVSAINELASGGSAADAKIGNLASLTTDVKDTLVNAINEVDAHADAAKAAADTAAAAAAAEATRAQGVEGTLANLTTTAKSNLVAAVNEVNAGLAAEVSRATTAEGTLTSNLAAEVARATGVEGSLAALTTDTKTSLQAAINEVDAHADANAAAIAAEVTRAQGVEGSLAALTTDAKGSLQAAINEVDAHADANASAISAEVSRATAAESAIDTKVGSLSGLSTTDKSSIVSAINEVKAAAGEGTGALKDAINAQRARYLATSAALVHTFTHNLNSADLLISVLVKDTTTGLFYNDMVAMEETNANTLTFTLTEAKIIKVNVQSNADLA